ncbi:MAG: ArsR/SmtB family transcription factor [Dehalococcoidia bacterium]
MKAADQQDRLFEYQAAICKTFANPWRLRIVEALGNGELAVSQLVEILDISKSNVSQHLGIMREKGVLEFRRQGGRVYYWVSNPKILTACRLMREVLLERLEQAGALSRLEGRR